MGSQTPQLQPEGHPPPGRPEAPRQDSLSPRPTDPHPKQAPGAQAVGRAGTRGHAGGALPAAGRPAPFPDDTLRFRVLSLLAEAPLREEGPKHPTKSRSQDAPWVWLLEAGLGGCVCALQFRPQRRVQGPLPITPSPPGTSLTTSILRGGESDGQVL